jgi:hypothetical protein
MQFPFQTLAAKLALLLQFYYNKSLNISIIEKNKKLAKPSKAPNT